MKKFPVTSNGGVYGATIADANTRVHHGKVVKLYVDEVNVYTFNDMEQKYQNDYIAMVKEAVRIYESIIARQRERAEMISKFEEWDGDCGE